MATRIAVPYNIFDSERGLIGADAHLWAYVEDKARLVLLLKPAEVLSSEPAAGHLVLEVRVRPEEQASDIHDIQGPAGQAKRHFLWKLARLIAPIPRPLDLWEYQYARRIAGELGSLKPTGRLAWLNLEVRGHGVYLSGGGVDPQYSWLIRHDRRLRAYLSARRIL